MATGQRHVVDYLLSEIDNSTTSQPGKLLNTVVFFIIALTLSVGMTLLVGQ